MTRLEALNTVLDAIGTYPVTSYESSHPDAVRAKQHLSRFNTEIQSRGWWFNQEVDLLLSVVDISNKILLPSNTLTVNPVDQRQAYVRRGNYLYDTVNHTFEFGGPVAVNLVSELEFVDLPISVQNYVARSAALEFAIVREGDQQKISKLETAMYTARSQAFSDELKNGNYNVFNSGAPARVIAGFRPAVRGL